MSNPMLNLTWAAREPRRSARLVLVAIADNANPNGFAWPSYETLAAKAALSRRQVIALLRGEPEKEPKPGKKRRTIQPPLIPAHVIVAYPGGGRRDPCRDEGYANLYLLRAGRSDDELRGLLATMPGLDYFKKRRFDPARVDPEHVLTVKPASLFEGDPTVKPDAANGEVLRGPTVKFSRLTVKPEASYGEAGFTQTFRTPAAEPQQGTPKEPEAGLGGFSLASAAAEKKRRAGGTPPPGPPREPDAGPPDEPVAGPPAAPPTAPPLFTLPPNAIHAEELAAQSAELRRMKRHAWLPLATGGTAASEPTPQEAERLRRAEETKAALQRVFAEAKAAEPPRPPDPPPAKFEPRPEHVIHRLVRDATGDEPFALECAARVPLAVVESALAELDAKNGSVANAGGYLRAVLRRRGYLKKRDRPPSIRE